VDGPSVQVNAVNLDVGALNIGRREKKFLVNNVLSILRRTVCSHQGDTVEHFLRGNEHHKNLRLALEKKDHAKVALAVAQIESVHLQILQKAWLHSVENIIAYFSITHKSPHGVRICLKGTKTAANSAGLMTKHIVDVFRQDGTRSEAQTPVSDNTGFKEVEKFGKYYLENNIPEAVRLRDYKNPRLTYRVSAAYKPPSRFLPKSFVKTDQNWINCWDATGSQPGSVSSCYKSTLIVPMTLINNPLSYEFFNETIVGMSAKLDRSIYGFLCFDHPSVDFFNDNDVNFGYIVADLLSVYLINRNALVAHSMQYSEAKKFLGDSKHG
jgi:hypothetical protein